MRKVALASVLAGTLSSSCASTPAPVAPPAPVPTPSPPPVATAPATPPAPAPADVTFRFTTLFNGNPAGSDVLVRHPGGTYDEDFEFNDRGRGPKMHVHVETGPDSLPTRVEIAGHDYLKREVHELATCDAQRCKWDGTDEHGEAPRAFYVPLYAGVPTEVLLRAAQAAPNGALPILPGGTFRASRVAETTLDKDGRKQHVVAWELAGFGLTPSITWTDDDGALFADVSDWSSSIREGWESEAPKLLEIQRPLGRARRERVAKQGAHAPAKGLAVVHARLFDPAKKRVVDDATVVIEGAKVTRVAPKLAPPAGFEVIDAKGKTVLPGLWDMHVHTSDEDGLLHLAEGVTTVRDLGNDMTSTLARRDRWDSGAELGPRVILAGFIDGRGPYQGPTGLFADTAEEALADVDKYAAAGYVQIKIYSSVKPELVPIIAKAAHAKGMRVSGHVPAHMIAEDAIDAGYDELQHVNFLFLDLVSDREADTRTPLRFTLVAQKGADVDLDAPNTKTLVDKLVKHHTVVDPTLSVFEEDFTIRPDHPSPTLAPILNRIPPQMRRGATSGGLPVPEGMDAKYRASFKRCEELVKRLWDRHVTIVAGTDNIPGFALHRELELYAEAGIPNAEVLSLATLGAARGSIAPGKDADLVIVDGDPLAKMSDVRNVVTVVKGGTVIDPRALESALSIAPR
jgi:imidazolonepropionase-like amidohydrolase